MEVLPPRSVGATMTALKECLDDLGHCDPFSLADPESILELNRLRTQVEGVVTKALAEFEAGGEWAIDGAQSAQAWLTTRCHLPKAQAQCLVRRGRALPHLPIASVAFLTGAIGAAQFDALAKVRTPLTEAALVRDEALLVAAAKELKFAPFVALLAYWVQCADPDGADEADMERRARRDVYLTPSVSGMFLGAMTLDPISGSIVSDELVRLERALFEGDWAHAKEHLGREPKLFELSRTSAQRRADALVEMATRSKIAPVDGRRPEPLFTVMVGYEALHGRISQLANGTVIAPGSLFEWMDHAVFERIVFAPGKRIECSPRTRFFTGATRRAIEVRDRECTHEYCDVTADRCQIDHIVPFGSEGLTTQENGRVHCAFHNRQRNHGPPTPGGKGLRESPTLEPPGSDGDRSCAGQEHQPPEGEEHRPPEGEEHGPEPGD